MTLSADGFIKITTPGDPELEQSNADWLAARAAEISMDGSVALIVIGASARGATLIVRAEAERELIRHLLWEALDIIEHPRQGRGH